MRSELFSISKHSVLSVLPILLLFQFVAISCQKELSDESRKEVAVTISPLAFIIQEMTLDTGISVTGLVPPGFSPVLYEFSPGDLARVESSRLFFYTSPRMEHWARRLPAKKAVPMIELLPESERLPMEPGHTEAEVSSDLHDHGPVDPHFWTDPEAVRSLLPSLALELCGSFPVECPRIQKNQTTFDLRLQELHRKIQEILKPVRGKSLILFHPSFRYMIRRYDLRLAGVIEPHPGSEPGPAYLSEMVAIIKKNKVSSLFTEPQLPGAPALAIAEAAGVPVYELDPLGGGASRDDLFSLSLFNANVIREALLAGSDH